MHPVCPRLVLASASPRRRELLACLGVPFDVAPSDVDEDVPGHAEDAAHGALLVAERKARHIALQPGMSDAVVLGADTIVVAVVGGEEQVLGKPADPEDARRMLLMLSGKTHVVYTALAVLQDAETPRTAIVATDVTFRPLSDADIEAYLATGEPFDKAGAYGIQEYGDLLVAERRGLLSNVIGLPVEELLSRLPEARP